MEIRIEQKGDSKVAVFSGSGIILNNVAGALDLMADARYNDCDKLLLHKENITEDFFELKTRFAGEVLQKYTNYGMMLAIVGEFHTYNSKSLNDFIYECNHGGRYFFKKTEAEALEALHGAAVQ